MAKHNELGDLGEALAVDYLLDHGYAILERNFRFDKAEIDIIAQKCEEFVIVVEVKTRNNDFFGDPQSFISSGKIKLLVKAANEFMVSRGKEEEVRFDVIAVLHNQKMTQLTHFENAFYHF